MDRVKQWELSLELFSKKCCERHNLTEFTLIINYLRSNNYLYRYIMLGIRVRFSVGKFCGFLQDSTRVYDDECERDGRQLKKRTERDTDKDNDEELL